ncbi:MAG TPA: tetratricopeptide repeat protein [Kofleriaceae bacterium]|jgi:Tfp pilus assembly protein PilF
MRTWLAALIVLCTASLAHADLASGRDKLTTGDYKAAISDLRAVTGKDRNAARVLLARALIATGEYAAAEATLTPVGTVDARLVLDHLRSITGRGADARKDLAALAKDHPDDREVRTMLAIALHDSGDVVGAKQLFDITVGEYYNKKLDISNPDQLLEIATAARYTSLWDLANDMYRAALKYRPEFTDAGIAWADLFLKKYAASLAEQTLEENVFKTNPNEPDAHAAMAEVIAETTYDLPSIKHHLEAALAINPHDARALKVRASLEIDTNQWEVANKTLDTVLAVNPEDLEAIAMKATVAWLRDDTKTYEALRQQALAIDPAYAELYRIVARSAVREHRYVAAVELDKQAIQLKPDFYEAMADAGLGFLRLGMEKEGLEWLEKAHAGDGYNVRTFNTLELYDKTIPKEYTFEATKDFKIRFHNDEKPALSRYVEPTLERAFADMVKRYGFTPKTPVIVELYADKTDYAVRTAGLPDLAALGVTFGQVITAMSPRTGDLNWGMILWHELGHVFAIQLSDSRVPRWFTEGLSEYETLTARPEWRRENDADLYTAVLYNTLPSIGDLNSEFMQPDISAVVVAYYQSAVTVEYLANTYGFPKIVEALKLFGQGKETPDVLKAITGKSVAELDRDFRNYLAVRLAPYAGTFKLPTRGFDDVTKLEIAADAAPKDARARANVALGYLYAGDADKATQAANVALALDRNQPIARYILAEVAVHAQDSDKAKELFDGLIADGHDSYDIRTRLAQLALDARDVDEAKKQLCAAKKLDPERSYPYQALSELYAKQGDQVRSLAELETYVFLEQMEYPPLKQLVEGYANLGNWAKVRTYGEMALYVNPQDVEVLSMLGNAYLQVGQPDKALYTFDTALVANPLPRRPALVQLGRARAFAAMKRKADAKTAIGLAMKTEPENAEVLAFKAQLK